MPVLKNNGPRASGLDLEIEQIQVSAGSSAAAATLGQSRIRSDYGAIVLAAIKPAGHTNFNPAGNTSFQSGDVLIALGGRSRLKEPEKMLEA
jgi:K+/H+ antiporter YhaU regulatory subunit KhtT